MPRAIPLVLALILALPLRGDSIAALRTFLVTLRGAEPVSATIDVSRARKSSGRFANNDWSGQVQYTVNVDNTGLQITLPQPLLERSARETREREADPKKMAPTRAAIDELQPSSIIESLSFAEPLARLLDIATLDSERPATWQGRPARLLSLTLKEKLPPQATSIFNVRFQQDHLTLWVADDHTPIAAERVRKGSARFLFLRGEMNSKESWTFTRRSDRLVVTRFESSFAGSGFGQRGEGRTLQTVTIR
ncbi:MAG TPA: hypothetical protein VMS98_16995 [Thermoanaerobaculia bacterium]|nr:hypothetical protein [Thermoanaerobaculia bacterium]